MYQPESYRVPCVIMRGGTSKAIFLLGNDIPRDRQRQDQVVLSIFGSPDRRQIDGLGGADPLTSKLAIIEPSDRPDADIDYTFGQVDIAGAFVDYASNCGNISSAVGPFAIEQGLVKATEPITTVRIYNTNTGKTFHAEVPVREGKPVTAGDYAIDGVPGTGAKIMLNMAGTIGSKTGRLLPTGAPQEYLDIIGFGKLRVSLVDAASPMVFVRASEIGLTGIETPAEIDGAPERLALLEQIRCQAAERMGMVDDWRIAQERVRAVPMVAFVSPPQDYVSFLNQQTVRADSIDFVSRVMFMQVMHKTYSGTATVCTGCAAVTPGTIVNEVLRRRAGTAEIRFGHPGGAIPIEMGTSGQGADLTITRAAYGRTARRIMEGYVYVPARYFNPVKSTGGSPNE